MKQRPGTTPMDEALKYLAGRPRTVLEVQRHLDGKNYGEYEVQAVVNRLLELGYLNDERFAADFITSRLSAKPVSRQHLERQLTERLEDRELARQAAQAVDDDAEYDNALRVAQKYWRQAEGLPREERRERVLRRLSSRGYAYETARRALLAAEGDYEQDG